MYKKRSDIQLKREERPKIMQSIDLRPHSRFNVRVALGILFFVLVIIASFVGYGFVRALLEGPEVVDSTNPSSPSLVNNIKRFVFSGNRLIDGYDKDRVNILIMGVGGAGHDGPQLSDTMILASFRPSDERIALLSIPRDMAVHIPGYGVQKINHANAYGEQDGGKGGELASQVVSDVLDEPIHYWVRIDFSAFEKLIDIVGGLEITIDQSFIDASYPDNNFGYQTIVFERGVELMNGERALQFARSRKGTSGEGSDFARARRQQKIISALKTKLLTPGTLTNPAKITKLFNTLVTHVDTNLKLLEMVEFAKKGRDVTPGDIVTHVLSIGEGQFLQELTNDYGYFLTPKAGDYSEIQTFVDGMFDEVPVAPPKPIDIDVSSYRDARVVILNGTWEPGLASALKERFEDIGVHVQRIGNTPERTYETTVIHQLNVSEKTDAALSRFAPLINTEVTRDPVPFTLEDKADMVVIIGLDYKKFLYGTGSGR